MHVKYFHRSRAARMGGPSPTYQRSILSLCLPAEIEIWALQNSQDGALDAYAALPTETAAQKIIFYYEMQHQPHRRRPSVRVGRMFVLAFEILLCLITAVPLAIGCISPHVDQWETIMYGVVTGVCLFLTMPLKATSLWFPRFWNHCVIRSVLILLCLAAYAVVVIVNPGSFDEVLSGSIGVGLTGSVFVLDLIESCLVCARDQREEEDPLVS
ncbi:hypothetical protein PROFUN_06848 [Planoprotostelium fungivorum]|uniref:Uncharacterized protein n=1 Tax=Planoprotostelium fungivorum TaxID=1890364 RepID=A0A2P6NNE6_9EUKA|nr:hypothetical protein PROFUN_06848 [Planoprotostelium fungivorum]